MKRVRVPLVAIIIATGLWFAFKPKNPVTPAPPVSVPGPLATTNGNNPPTPATTRISSPVTEAAAATAQPDVKPAALAAPDGSPAPIAPLTASLPPLTVLDNARVVMHNYASAFGENPVGDNSEITAALLGKNPKQVNFISEESGLRVNASGELTDAWGTPFFFHQLSARVMEIRSAGEDKKMWTFDDQVTR